MPGAQLHAGHEEIIVPDLVGPREPTIAGSEKPILNGLRPELDFGR
jgi:beta-galactosidase